MTEKKLLALIAAALILAVSLGALAIERAINRQTDKCMLADDR